MMLWPVRSLYVDFHQMQKKMRLWRTRRRLRFFFSAFFLSMLSNPVLVFTSYYKHSRLCRRSDDFLIQNYLRAVANTSHIRFRSVSTERWYHHLQPANTYGIPTMYTAGVIFLLLLLHIFFVRGAKAENQTDKGC